jgi:uncharacterized SAM-binding protein YcdF (DUF218 family)
LLSKFVAWLVSPLGTALVLMVVAALLRGGIASTARAFTGHAGYASSRSRMRRGRAAQWLAGAAFVWLWIWSSAPASDALRGWIEEQSGPRALADVRAAEYAVVLGGSMSTPRPPLRPDPDLGMASDRVWHAARLFHAGKVRRLLLCGGSSAPTERPTEADSMRRFLLDLGVPDSAIVLERSSTTTASNAEQAARMLRALNVDTIVLVTSALHMPRARANFERVGLVVHPAPTDFEIVEEPFELDRWLPSTRALDGSARAFKELLGRAAGR